MQLWGTALHITVSVFILIFYGRGSWHVPYKQDIYVSCSLWHHATGRGTISNKLITRGGNVVGELLSLSTRKFKMRITFFTFFFESFNYARLIRLHIVLSLDYFAS